MNRDDDRALHMQSMERTRELELGAERSSAVISPDGRYRYRLYREWSSPGDRRPLMWMMLNPSTADATRNDPTIRRCIAFSKAWGYPAMWVGNLYAIRSADPSILRLVTREDARGPENDRHLLEMSGQSARVVLAWGAPGGRVIPAALNCPGGYWCLGTTKTGSPLHPLYVAARTPLMEFRP